MTNSDRSSAHSLLEDSTLLYLLLSAVVIAAAGLVHGTLGLGFPLVATPLLALFMDLRTAILLTLLPTVAVNLVSIVRGGEWRQSIGRFWPLGVSALAGSGLGAWLLTVGDPAPYSLLLAGLVLLYLGTERASSFNMAWVRRWVMPSMLVFGLIAGLSAGTTNVMVPILIIYTL